MSVNVTFTEDPARVLAEARKLLAADPVRNNLLLTLLEGRVSRPGPGRYWLAEREGAAVGVVFQSPLDYPALVTPMGPEATAALVAAIAGGGHSLAGVNGEAATAAAFAGQWTEATSSAAAPTHGFRVYEAPAAEAPSGVSGRLRQARQDDRDLLVRWACGFLADINDQHGGPEQMVEQRAASWPVLAVGGRRPSGLNGGPLAAGGGVVRLQAVYTPPESRNRGYASAYAAALTARLLALGLRCILHTGLANPTSNSIYRRIGYRAVEEVIRHRFEAKRGDRARLSGLKLLTEAQWR